VQSAKNNEVIAEKNRLKLLSPQMTIIGPTGLASFFINLKDMTVSQAGCDILLAKFYFKSSF
jgi:hypothetical protein